MPKINPHLSGLAGEDGLGRIPFSAESEATIKSLAGWMLAAGVMHGFAALAALVIMILMRDPGQGVGLILHTLVGVWVIQASSSFKKVATTNVADQSFLVQGLSRLGSIFFLQAAVILVTLAFVVTGLILVVIVTLTRA